MNKKALKYILLAPLTFAFFVMVGVTAQAAPAPENGTDYCASLKEPYYAKCATYVADVAKCAADDTACGQAAYKKYITAVCKTNTACAKDKTKVLVKPVAVAQSVTVGSIYPNSEKYSTDNNPIITWLKVAINIFAGIIGIGAVLMIIVGGLQYSAARDNPQAVQAAKTRIANVVLGLAAFIFLYAFLQWLIPGGAF
ncbi:MAG: hypothetical protein U0491_00930 [Candidatus Saccharimonadales bacterium]